MRDRRGSCRDRRGVALKHAGIDDVLIVDRHGVGASFDRWPQETTFLTPSFPTNSIGMLDLNAIAIGTSPAYSLGKEHPSGQAYASYLRGVQIHFELNVRSGIDVLTFAPDEDGFHIETNQGIISSRFVIWAAGEFQYPNSAPFRGAELCQHSSTFASFRDYSHDNVIVIGGYESGIDAAIHLASFQKKVTVLSRGTPWNNDDSDPSISLSTYTQERKLGGMIELVKKADVFEVKRSFGKYSVQARGRRIWRCPGPPILATGFRGSHCLLSEMFDERQDGCPHLNEHDESTVTSNLFFAGPMAGTMITSSVSSISFGSDSPSWPRRSPIALTCPPMSWKPIGIGNVSGRSLLLWATVRLLTRHLRLMSLTEHFRRGADAGLRWRATGRIVFWIFAWMAVLYGILKFSNVTSSISGVMCGPWGCTAPLEAVVACRLAWLMVLAPVVTWSVRDDTREHRRSVGLGLTAFALVTMAGLWALSLRESFTIRGASQYIPSSDGPEDIWQH